MGAAQKAFGICWVLGLGLCATGWAAESITLKFPGGSARGEVVKVTNSEVVLKNSAGKEQIIPAAMLEPKDLLHCRRQILDPKDAKGHFELGEFCLKKNLKEQAKEFLTQASTLDPAAYKLKVEDLLGAKPETPAPAEVAQKPEEKQPEKEAPKTTDPEKKDGDGEWIEVRGPNGQIFKIPANLMANQEEIEPKKPDEWEKFKTDRLQELKRVCGGDWKVEETAHYCLFNNLDPKDYEALKVQCEGLYGFLKEVMDYKEGDPLWNNKCPVYFIKTRNQFLQFASQIDRAPGAANSGGYFRHRGREVHIVIPLYDWMNGKQKIETATSTLYHEGTHAFLQLVGKNTQLNSWLHEGMAQFIEFLCMERYTGSNNLGDRNRAVGILRQSVRDGDVISWYEGRQRPMGGGDHPGYAFAWSRFHFLYTCFRSNPRALPTMINAIKDGKSEEDAMKAAFGKSYDELEQGYRVWMEQSSKNNFK